MSETNYDPDGIWMCVVCGYKYYEKKGDASQNVALGTKWEDIDETWLCPDCSMSKDDFIKQ